MRRAAKVDANHAAIRDALRQRGWAVFDFSGMGKGLPDLLACKARRVVFIEVKDGSKPPSRRALTPAQQKVHAEFAGSGFPIVIIESEEQVIALDGKPEGQ